MVGVLAKINSALTGLEFEVGALKQKGESGEIKGLNFDSI